MSAPILITGAGGCIGAWTIKQLQDAGCEVIAFDLSAERQRLVLLYDDATRVDAVVWETGDIADSRRVAEVFARYRPAAVIHLAALQVPFCKADPAAGARVNVVGSINVFEAARQHGVKKIVYASSVAATAMGFPPWLETLYGAYKICNEQTARVYWRDWKIPSIGIRPSVVYGPARDQGMSAAPTVAMLAAVTRRSYVIPFSGSVGFVYAAEAAAAFIGSVEAEQDGAYVFSLNGQEKSVEEVVQLIQRRYPDSDISCTGAALPFPSDTSDEPLRAHIGDYYRLSFEEGMDETLSLFSRRAAAGRINFPEGEGL